MTCSYNVLGLVSGNWHHDDSGCSTPRESARFFEHLKQSFQRNQTAADTVQFARNPCVLGFHHCAIWSRPSATRISTTAATIVVSNLIMVETAITNVFIPFAKWTEMIAVTSITYRYSRIVILGRFWCDQFICHTKCQSPCEIQTTETSSWLQLCSNAYVHVMYFIRYFFGQIAHYNVWSGMH